MAGGAVKVKALGRHWEWPDNDVKCRDVVFEWSRDLYQVYPFCRSFRTAIQAGGNMGVWPWLLASRFQKVITAEPEPDCLRCLLENIKDLPNVAVVPYALGEFAGRGNIVYVPANMGAQFVQAAPTGEVEITTIDRMGILDCDLIYLDIEGAEGPALRGAVDTIARCRPASVTGTR